VVAGPLARISRLLRGLTVPKALGPHGERLAARHLKRHGYRILARNLRTGLGEIDLLVEAPDRRTIVVVEVKTGSSSATELRPELHVNVAKQRKLAVLAAQLLRQQRLRDRPIRFDVIGIDVPEKGPAVIRHHEGAFESHL
jgi:putative endonuclease